MEIEKIADGWVYFDGGREKFVSLSKAQQFQALQLQSGGVLTHPKGDPECPECGGLGTVDKGIWRYEPECCDCTKSSRVKRSII